jgi:hypothetical protein
MDSNKVTLGENKDSRRWSTGSRSLHLFCNCGKQQVGDPIDAKLCVWMAQNLGKTWKVTSQLAGDLLLYLNRNCTKTEGTRVVLWVQSGMRAV